VARLILFNKPYGVLSQFTDRHGRKTLADYIAAPGVYPAGRLDYDSEGLMLLTDDGTLQARIAEPQYKLPKRYWLQVIGQPDSAALRALTTGVNLRDGVSRADSAFPCDPPSLPPRVPAVVERHARVSSWLVLVLLSGRNREARRLLAAVGHPVLRLVRSQIGPWTLEGLAPGASRAVRVHLPRASGPGQKRHGRPAPP
jgi:23S rRNA pseudouridine2457 synthase